MTRIILLGFYVLLCETVQLYANPLNLSTYSQEVTLTFANHADASTTTILPLPLPGGKKLAFSARWDDTTPGHLNTIKVMAKHGAKGTFFSISPTNDIAKAILACGSSIGLHTVVHPYLSSQNPNEQFFQYMYNKIILESQTNSPVTTQALPFCDYQSPRRYTQIDIGKVVVVPYPFSINRQNSIIISRGVTGSKKNLPHAITKNVMATLMVAV